MTYRDENIVNISIAAAELLRDGKIERDDVTGHAGFTEAIINLAEKFERENSGVDYNAGERDYWVDIEAFAERELIAQYGVECAPEQEPLEIKVIIDNGITVDVLKNQAAPVNVEVLDIDEDYEDYEQLRAYRNQLYADKEYLTCSYTTAHFEEDEIEDVFEAENETLDEKINAAEERHQEQLDRINRQKEQENNREEERY